MSTTLYMMKMIKFGEIENGRYERKFFIEELSREKVESIIKDHPARTVNNLYLDTPDLSEYRKSVDGNSQRIKIRIRWYGDLFGQVKQPVLEIKIKSNNLGDKISFPLKGFEIKKNFDYAILKKALDNSQLPEWVDTIVKQMVPILLNSYQRSYFQSANKCYRITVDDNQIFYSVGKINNTFSHSIKDKKNVILEIKYKDKEENKINKISQHIPFRMTKHSKYVYGVNLIYG